MKDDIKVPEVIPVPSNTKKQKQKETPKTEEKGISAEEVLIPEMLGKVVIQGKTVEIKPLNIKAVLTLTKILNKEFEVVIKAVQNITIATKGKPSNLQVANAIIEILEVDTVIKIISLILSKDENFVETLSLKESIDVVLAFIDAQEIQEILLRVGRLKTTIITMKKEL